MILNELGDQGALNQLLQRRLNIIGAAPAPSLMPEIAPTLVLENDRPELSVLKAEYRFAFRIALVAVAAEFPAWFIPGIANSVMVIERLLIQSATAATWRVEGAVASPAFTMPIGITNPSHVDDRMNPTVSMAVQSGTLVSTAVTVERSFASVRVLANDTLTVEGPWILTGRSGLLIYSIVANQNCSLSASGYYRKALPGELG